MWWVTEIWESGDGMIDRYDPNFVVLGGGTGISTLLRGLKRFSKNITAIVTMADEAHSSADTTLACFRGYADCVEGAVEKGVIIGSGVYEPGKVKNTLAMKQAYEMGKNV